MKSHIGAVLLLAVLPVSMIVMTGCSADGNGNASITIYNDTDRTVRAYYSYDEKDDSSTSTQTSSTTSNEVAAIRAGNKLELFISGNSITNPDVRIVFGGIVKDFSVETDLLGYGKLHITHGDFYTP